MEIGKSDIQAAIDAGIKIGNSGTYEVSGTPMAFVPNNYELKMLDDHRERPLRTSAGINHHTTKSFCDYYNRFSNNTSAIFLDNESGEFSAILDYHEPDTPNWLRHKSIFKPKMTVEWGQWKANDKKQMCQEDFGKFIERNLLEIVVPANGEMLEIALNLQAHTKVDFSQAKRLDNGQVQISYIESTEGKAGVNGSLKIPTTFAIGLRLFEGAPAYQIEANFRYRIKDANLTLWYELIRPHKVIEACVTDMRTAIETGITKNLRIYEGIY